MYKFKNIRNEIRGATPDAAEVIFTLKDSAHNIMQLS